MNSPIAFTRKLQVDKIADYDKLPGHMFIDIFEASNQFFEDSLVMRFCEYSFDEIVGEILMYIATDEMADVGLQAFHDDMKTIHSAANGIDEGDGKNLADAALKLGQALLFQFRALKVYTPEGVFPYIQAKDSDPLTLHLEKYAPGKEEAKPVRLDPTRLYHTRGVYVNGEYKDNFVEAQHMEAHIWYNKMMRPGRALFVSGHCFNQGYLTDAEVSAMHSELNERPVTPTHCTAPYH